MLTIDVLRKLWVNGDQHVPGLLEGMAAAAPDVFPKYGLTSDLLIAHFMAQVSEECGAGLEMRENMNYSAPRLLVIFPTHFTPSLAARAAHNPQMIAEIAYGGRMGNKPPPSTDGWIYRGGGLTQCTGENGYAALQAWLDKAGVTLDVLANPDLVASPGSALLCGVGDFLLCGCLPYAEKDDVVGVSAMLNVGHIVPARQINGLSDREQWLVRWKAALGVS